MPILEVELVGEPAAGVREGLAAMLADAVGTLFGSDPMNTWVVLRVLPVGDYAENAAAPGARYAPVFVRVLKRTLPSERELKMEAAGLTSAVAEVCGRDPAQVHVIYEPAAAGRVSFGGRLAE
jgi:phenylpyruvate tautomerase PptA (4-oxalocrotonate tautomerase family)